ncbi:MAG TPA: hypothetical protein VFD84_17470 [Candidatus Binatia bacterium]|nr:hypothetical protein [Candidatus Binatia bacterium]
MTFDGRAKAIRRVFVLADDLRAGIEIRARLHTGEVGLRDDDVGGIAVHTASVMAEARPGEVLVFRTVSRLVLGSAIWFVEQGAHALEGRSRA